MPSLAAALTTVRRLIAVVATTAVLFSASAALAQSDKKDDAAEKKSKNYSIPWVITLLSLAIFAAPVAIATQRKWEVPTDDDE
jgi:phosphate/sulfate permease